MGLIRTCTGGAIRPFSKASNSSRNRRNFSFEYIRHPYLVQNTNKLIGSEHGSGITCPDIIKVAEAHGLEADCIANTDELNSKVQLVLSRPGPFVCEGIMPETQPLIPRVSSLKKPDGSIISKPLEDLYPFLDRKEFAENMIVDTVEILK